MSTKIWKSTFFVLLASVIVVVVAISAAFAAAPWHATGSYQIDFRLDSDPSTPYVHDAILTQTGASVDGTGGYPAGGPHTYTWDITAGSVSGDTINLTVDYLTGAPGTTMTMVGTIASDGTVAGTWADNFGGTRTGTWSITAGISTPLIHTPANNAIVTQSAFTEIDWTDALGANPPFQYQYEAYSDAGYSALIYASGWTLTNSEIPTPGTPPGDYYVRVQARDEGLVESDWSNDDTNPYHITVTADVTPTPTPINPFPVPAECDQNIAYNLIEGTGGSEVINGTSGNDLILARGGSDVVNGKAGDDCIVGGAGSDSLRGDGDNDVILGGANSDSITGGTGNDDLYGEGGSDALNGNAGDDDLFGGADSDSLKGEGGSDTLTGNGGSDAANGGANTDTCSAEAESNCEI